MKTSKKHPNAAIFHTVVNQPPRPSDTPPVQEGKVLVLRFSPIFAVLEKTYPCEPSKGDSGAQRRRSGAGGCSCGSWTPSGLTAPTSPCGASPSLRAAVPLRRLTRVGFLKTFENGRKTQKQELPLLDRRGVRRTGWSMANRARKCSVWVFFRRFQSTTPGPSCPGGELILSPQRQKTYP